MSAGTGGTSATIGRYIRCQGYDTQLMVVDPQNSVFLDYWQNRNAELRSPVGSKIEGIGRPRVEPSFIPDVVDEMLRSLFNTANFDPLAFLDYLHKVRSLHHGVVGARIKPCRATVEQANF